MAGNVFKLRETPKKILNKIYYLGLKQSFIYKIYFKDLLHHEIKLKYFEKRNQEEYNHIDINFAYLATKLLKKFNNGSS